MAKDITDQVRFGANDGDSLPLEQCACGKKFNPWDFLLGTSDDRWNMCPACGRRMYFTVTIRVFEVEEGANAT